MTWISACSTCRGNEKCTHSSGQKTQQSWQFGKKILKYIRGCVE